MLDTTEDIPMDERVCRAVAKVHAQIKASVTPNLPLFWTEWNVQGNHESRDTTFVGPALANTIRQCDGLVDQMSFWTFSDVFEEGGPFPKPFLGAFGLRAKGGINKPSFYAFSLLHRLGSERLSSSSPNVLVTRRSDSSLVIAVWNLVDPPEDRIPSRMSKPPSSAFHLVFQGVVPDAELQVQQVDDDHGNVLPKYASMGNPVDPTDAQVERLNSQTSLGPPSQLKLNRGALDLTLQPNALVLIELGPASKAK